MAPIEGDDLRGVSVKKLLVIAAAVVLGGCNATMPTAQSNIRITTDDDPSRKCFAALANKPELQVLQPKVGSIAAAAGVGLEHMARQDKATDDDKAAIKVWADERNKCIESGKQFRQMYQPVMYNGLPESSNAEFIIAMSKLYSGEWTYGQFSSHRKQLSVKYDGLWQAARQQEGQANQASQSRRAAEQAQANADFANAMLLMQAAQPRPSAPILAPSISCSSRAAGGTVFTDCR